MKHVRLILQFYSKNKMAFIVLVTIMTVSLYFFTQSVGKLQYLHYTHGIYQSAGLNNAIYFMPQPQMMNGPAQKDTVQSLIGRIGEQPGVRSIITIYNATYINKSDDGSNMFTLFLYDEPMEQSFIKGMRLDQILASSVADIRTNQIPVIVGGPLMTPFKNGSVIQVGSPSSPMTISLKVVKNMGLQFYVPYFGQTGGKITSDTLFMNINAVLIRKSSQADEILRFAEFNMIPSPNFFVDFKHDATRIEMDNCLNELRKYGSYQTDVQIRDNTLDLIQNRMKASLPIPLFFLIVSLISFLSVSILIVSKKMNEHSIYFLCGCSRWRSFQYMAASIFLASLIPFLVNTLIVTNYRLLPFAREDIFYDANTILILFAYGLFITALAVSFPYWSLKRSTPIEIRRRLSV